MMDRVTVVGAGLAGYEVAWQLVKRKIPVWFVEMWPKTPSPTHHSENFAEFVCSNSPRSNSLSNVAEILKEEARHLDSIIMESAKVTWVPVGSALAVDRQAFSRCTIEQLKQHPLTEIAQEEVTQIPDGPCIIASGPLTSDALSRVIREYTYTDYFHFYDAAVPIIEKDSIDFSKAYTKSRYDEEEAAYTSCAISREEFDTFYEELTRAETTQLYEFEDETCFEGCIPLEEVARRSRQTLLFESMEPVGLERPDGTTPYTAVQLRQDNAVVSLYSVVGFQTHLKWGGQKYLLSMIPGLENVSIMCYGVVHHNFYLCAPRALRPIYQYVQRDDLFLADQPRGVGGYVGSAASGSLAGINMANLMRRKAVVELPNMCVIRSMAHCITHASEHYLQPVNANFGTTRLLEKMKKEERKEVFVNQTLSVVDTYKEEFD